MIYRVSLGVALMAVQVAWLHISWLLAFSVTFAIYLASGGWRFLRLLCLTFPRDLRYTLGTLRGLKPIKKAVKNNWTVCDIFQETVKKHKEKVAFVFEDKYWTFQEMEIFSNKVANYFQSAGYKKGDVVAIMIENRPESVFFWLGLAKIGVISSLINYNLRKESLAHCISIVNAKGLIYSSDTDIADAVADISSNLDDVELFEFENGNSKVLESQDILEKLKFCSENPPPQLLEKRYDDVLLYIYTSGTTGLPKACVVSHVKYFSLGYIGKERLNFRVQDVMYCVLPLYHTAGVSLGVASVIVSGVTLVVRRKFSASRFWDDCIRYKVTGAQYIGELCRYLLAQPRKEIEKKHSLRFMVGNGIRPQIWNEFKTRFNIPSIVEIYGSTEGNVGLVNTVNHPGAIGFLPVIFPQFSPARIFKMDHVSGELLRGADGLCMPCKPGEVGQIAGRINARKGEGGSLSFDGYLSKQSTSKKIAHDVLEKGDHWFITGDTIYWDELGFAYFHDRLGDTFRWCGENVSTTEVEGAIIQALGLKSVVVYGVKIPGCEGRAGMAAIEDPDDVIDVQIFRKNLSALLPKYARPVFLRITSSVETTGTFKFQKGSFQKDGFNLSVVEDKIFYFDSQSDEYCVLTKTIYKKFLDCEMRV